MVIKLLPRYLLTFGLIGGLLAFLQVEILRLYRVRLFGYQYPIFLRRGTTDTLAFREIFLFNSYKFPFKDPKIIIDGGANIGLTSIYFKKQFDEAVIYAVEPDASNFSTLCANVDKLNSVTCIQSALWCRDTFLKIKDKREREWAYVVEECSQDDSSAFAAVSIASLMKKYSLERIDILKLDIEGAERELFSDNVDHWIRRTKYIFIELHDWLKKDSSKAVFKTVAEYHFSTSVVNGMLLFVNQELD